MNIPDNSGEFLTEESSAERNYERFLQFAAAGTFGIGFLVIPAWAMLLPLPGNFKDIAASCGPLAALIVLLAAMRRCCGTWSKVLEVLEIKRLDTGFACTVPLLAVLLMLISGSTTLLWQSFMYTKFGLVFDVPPTVDMGMNGTPVQAAMLAITALLAAPVLEEILFRRVLFGFMKQRYGVIAGYIGSALLFAVMHCSLAQLPGLFILALFWQYIYCRKQNLSVSIMLHFCNNLCSMALLLLSRYLELPLN